MAKENESRNSEFYNNLKTSVETEIKKANENKETELAKIENEVTNLKALIVKHEGILQDEIDVFYSNRVKNLEKFLKDISILENLPNADESEAGSILTAHYEKMKTDFSQALEKKIDGEAEFLASKMNDKMTVGSVNFFTPKPKVEYKMRQVETDFRNPSFYISTEEHIYVPWRRLIRKFFVNLESTILKSYKNSDQSWEHLLNSPDILRSNFDLQKGWILTPTGTITSSIKIVRQRISVNYAIIKNNQFYCISDEKILFGPSIEDECHYKIEFLSDEFKFKDLLDKIFNEDIEVLFNDEKIFLLDISSNSYNTILQKNLVGEEERIVASRRKNDNEIALVFQNIALSQNLIIKYFSKTYIK